jgi:hypothetical protein
MKLARDVALGVAESIRESLPSDEKEAGPFLAGFTWAFVLHWAILVLSTWAWFSAQRPLP